MNNDQMNYLWDKIKSIKVGMLTSRDGKVLRSRPMYLAQNEFSGTLWFFTRADSHKALEVDAQSDVNISFMDIDSDEYVSVSGVANVSKDQEKIASLWNPMVATWFPEGDDPNAVALLEVNVTSAEVWDAEEGKMSQMIDMLEARMTSERPNLGENARLS